MTLESTLNPTNPADAGRDTKGRFKPGNHGGPGNPNAGKMAQFRQVVLGCVTYEEMRAAARKLYEMAIEGHWQSMKLFLLYTCGKPEAMPTEMIDAYLQMDNAAADAAPPSANGDLQNEPSANGVNEEIPPSPNGDFSPPLNRQQRRAMRKAYRLEKQKRNTPKPATPPSTNGVSS
jgi:hypothetical protein